MMVRGVYGYGRASTDRQILSTEQQESVVLQWFNANKLARADWAEAEWRGFFADVETSRTTKLREREAGSQVIAACGEGDLIVASNYDRMFANVVDICEMFDLMSAKRFGIRCLDLDIPLDTDLGQAVFKLMAVIKELEVKEIRRRIKGMLKHLRESGHPTGTAPFGWKTIKAITGGKRKTYFKEDMKARRFAEKIARIKAEKGIGIKKLVTYCNTHNLLPLKGGIWDAHRMRRMLRAYRDNFPLKGGHTPAPIPPDALPVPGVPTIVPDDVNASL